MATFGQAPVGDGLISSAIKVGNPVYIIKVYGELVTGNAIDLDIDGASITTTTYSVSTPYTLQVLADNLAANAKVSQSNYLGYNQAEQIYKVQLVGSYQNQLDISNLAITGGASQVQIEVVYDGGIDEIPLSGIQDSAPRLTSRTDSTTATAVIYGFALANSDEDDPVWYIYQINTATANISKTLFPTTGSGFNYSWTNRGAITFS